MRVRWLDKEGMEVVHFKIYGNAPYLGKALVCLDDRAKELGLTMQKTIPSPQKGEVRHG